MIFDEHDQNNAYLRRYVSVKNSNELIFISNAGNWDNSENAFGEFLYSCNIRQSEARSLNLLHEDDVDEVLKDIIADRVKVLRLSVHKPIQMSNVASLAKFLKSRHSSNRVTIVNTRSSDNVEALVKEMHLVSATLNLRIDIGHGVGSVRRYLSAVFDRPIGDILPYYDTIGFLDIDGVLQNKNQFLYTGWAGNTASHFTADPIEVAESYDKTTVAFLHKFSKKAKMKWYLCSQQRIIIPPQAVNYWGKLIGIDIVGVTPNLGDRNKEIEEILKFIDYKGTALIMDDEPATLSKEWSYFQPSISISNPLSIPQMENICAKFNVNFMDLMG